MDIQEHRKFTKDQLASTFTHTKFMSTYRCNTFAIAFAETLIQTNTGQNNTHAALLLD